MVKGFIEAAEDYAYIAGMMACVGIFYAIVMTGTTSEVVDMGENR